MHDIFVLNIGVCQICHIIIYLSCLLYILRSVLSSICTKKTFICKTVTRHSVFGWTKSESNNIIIITFVRHQTQLLFDGMLDPVKQR